MITLSVDKGVSFTKAVLWDKRKIIKYLFNQALPKADKIIRVTPKIEFGSLAKGGLYLSGLKSAIVVSCGTGTAVVWARKNKPVVHLGGTGVGGGTLQGLGKLILKTDSVEKYLSWQKRQANKSGFNGRRHFRNRDRFIRSGNNSGKFRQIKIQ